MVKEETALAVRDFVRMYLDIDEFGASQPNFSYPIHSLYLDSDELTTYWETINGNKNRYKLRLRYYDNLPTSPVFFEIKRRQNDAILKQRGAVRREAVNWLLAGHLPEPGHLISSDSRQLVALQRFSQLMNQLHARPKAHIYYLREAWISRHNNSVRVTMDRAVNCDPESSHCLSSEMRRPVIVFGKNVILELKFNGRFPNWFGDLVRAYGLVQGAAAKYADGIALIGEEQVGSRAWDFEESDTSSNLEARRSFLRKLSDTNIAKSAA